MIKPTPSFLRAAAVAAVCSAAMSQPAFAISADLAKKCRELAVKAHPPAIAGSKTGTAQAERGYYQACVARGGNMSDDNGKK